MSTAKKQPALGRRFVGWTSVALIAAVLGFNSGACTKGTVVGGKRWTTDEIANAQYFLEALNENNAATRLVNGPGGTAISSEDVREVLSRLRASLSAAQRVSDSVLDKACPGLSREFRTKFEPGLTMLIRGLERNDAVLQQEANTLLNEWADWLEGARHRITIPKARR